MHQYQSGLEMVGTRCAPTHSPTKKRAPNKKHQNKNTNSSDNDLMKVCLWTSSRLFDHSLVNIQMFILLSPDDAHSNRFDEMLTSFSIAPLFLASPMGRTALPFHSDVLSLTMRRSTSPCLFNSISAQKTHQVIISNLFIVPQSSWTRFPGQNTCLLVNLNNIICSFRPRVDTINIQRNSTRKYA